MTAPSLLDNGWAMLTTNLGDLIDRTIDLDRPAIIDLRVPATPRTWSHREIDRLAGGIARHLTGLGLARGTRVALVSANRAEYAAAFFGIMRAGFVATVVNVKLARDTVDFIMEDAGIAFAFADEPGTRLLPPGMPHLAFDDPGPAGFSATIVPAAFETVPMAEGEIGQMLYTSGSTGRPKGVPLSHSGQLWALATRTAKLVAADRYIIAQPLFHMNGLFSLKTVFATNASVVLMPGFDTRPYIEALSRHAVTAVMAVPTMFARIVKEEVLVRSLPFRLKRIGLGSAPITLALIERIAALFPQATIGLGYGTTEAGPAVFGPHPDGLPTPPLSLGYPLAGAEVRWASDPEADSGVLLMRNPAVMAGYQNLPETTAKALSDGWYDSGDVMRRDAEGFYFFVGRADDMFVCSGENIYPAEVERLLERHPDVQQAAVVPLPDEERGQMPVAFVVTREDRALTAAAIKAFTLANGPAYQHPRRIELLPELPWAGTNKVDRKALIERARSLEVAHGWSA